MPVPEEADSKQGNTSNSQQQQQQQPPPENSASTSPSTTPSVSSNVSGGSNVSALASPAPPALISSAHKDEATSPKVDEIGLACDNGGSAASSPIDVASEEQPPL